MAAVALAAPMAAFSFSSPTDAPTIVGAPQTAIVDPAAVTQAFDISGVPEEAAMVLIGTLLIGFAAAVRRAA